MIEQLSIKNFKSIKKFQMPCKKINVLIGEPNSGKSNIIEALSLQSQNAVGISLNKDMVRYKSLGNLFYDFNINQAIEIQTDKRLTSLLYHVREDGIIINEFHFFLDKNDKYGPIIIEHDGKIKDPSSSGKTNVHYYEYKRLDKYVNTFMPHLSVPFGVNLANLLIANVEHKKWVSEFFSSKGLKLTLMPTENDITISKFVNDEIYSFPYFTISETLQRIVFYIMAIRSNKEAVLLFDEPESNTFPFYTKFLAERIALDESNQFFITTHNPYLLLSLIEKTKIDNLNVCIAQMKDYQTKLVVLNQEQISKVLDFESDVFFNFDKVLSK